MTFASNRQPAFRAPAWIPLLVSLLLLAGAAWASPARTVTDLRLAPGYDTDARMDTWLAEDIVWLRGGQQTAPSNMEDLETLRAWTEARAALRDTSGSSAPGVRAAESHLRDRWFSRGYPDARVRIATGEPDSLLVLQVDPGEAYAWGEILVTGPDFHRREALLALCLPEAGEVFRAEELDLAARRILAGAGESGHPFTRWLVKTVKVDTLSRAVDVEIALYPGQAAVWGEFRSNLPSGRGESFLFRAAGLRPGSPFRESDLERARDRLLMRGLYTLVEPPVVYRVATADTVGCFWRIVEREKANRISVVFGLSRGQQDDRSRLSGDVDLRLPNLAGSGRRLDVRWSDDGGDRSTLSFGYLEPLAFGTPLDLDCRIDHEVLGDSYNLFRVETKATMAVVAAWGLELGFGWDRSTFPSGSVARSSRIRARGALAHKRFDPLSTGWSAVLALETAERTSFARETDDEGLSPNGVLSDDRQTLLTADIDGELWLASAWALAGRGAWREIRSGQDSVPLVEQYRFGGASTVRGRREGEYHGSTAAWTSVELRVGRPGRARLYTFYDIGYFQYSALDPAGLDADTRVNKRDTVRGFGLGLRTRGAGGDLSLAIGFPGEIDFERAKLHVTLLEAF